MQEAQAALLAKEDDLVMLRRELLSLKAQLHKPSDSATLPTKPHPSAAQHAAAHHSASAESKAQPSSSGKPDLHQGSNKSRGAESAEVGDSGLPSLSLPATPHSPGGSPRGESFSELSLTYACKCLWYSTIRLFQPAAYKEEDHKF